MYESPSILRIAKCGRLQWARDVACTRGKECIQIFVGESLWKTNTGQTKKKMGDNIKMDLREVDCEDGKWMESGGEL